MDSSLAIKFSRYERNPLIGLPLDYLMSFLFASLVYLVQIYFAQSIPTTGFMFFYPTVFFIAWIFGPGPALTVLLASAYFVGTYVLKGSPLLRSGMYLFNSSLVIGIIFRYKLNEKLLEEREKRMNVATDSSKVGVWELDLLTGKVNTNLQHDRLFGYIHHQKNWDYACLLAHIHPEDREHVVAKLERSKITSVVDMECRIRWLNGTTRWLSIKGTTEFDEDGKPVKMIGTNFDITDKKSFEASLHEALFYRDEFLSIASHELKTPLTSLKLQCQLFKRASLKNELETYTRERVDRLVSETDRQVDRLARLVNDMLDISRIRTGKLSFTKEKVDLKELVQDVVERMRLQFEESGRSVPQLTAQEVGLCYCDRIRIEQVLMNLLNNSYRYGNALPVYVELRREKNLAVVKVIDSGIGIAPENHEKIFSRFQRAIPASEVSGLGLGLYIAKQIIDAHGGTISVESELNKGAAFKFEIPLMEQH